MTGAEALDFLFCTGAYQDRGGKCRHPKVILLDLKLPKVNGLEVLRRIKSDEQTRTIPVVMMTSSREVRDVVESYRLGVNNWTRGLVPLIFDALCFAQRVLVRRGDQWK